MKMTVYFDGVFWCALIEYSENGNYKAFRHVFGSSPTNDEIFKFIDYSLEDLIKKYSNLKTNMIDEKTSLSHRNPKRIQRELSREKKKKVLSTKAQQSIQQLTEAMKKERKKQIKRKHEQEKEQKFQLKQKKRLQKKKGH